MDDNGWTSVSHRRKAAKHGRAVSKMLQESRYCTPVEDTHFCFEEFMKKLTLCSDELTASNFWTDLKVQLSHLSLHDCHQHEVSKVKILTENDSSDEVTVLTSSCSTVKGVDCESGEIKSFSHNEGDKQEIEPNTHILDTTSVTFNKNMDYYEELVCYGVGKFSSSMIARYQLALFLLLREYLQISKEKCFLYDPVFTESEVLCFQKLPCTLIATNEECLRPVSENTLFFMPHCGKPLYNNLLYSNWYPLKLPLVTLLGNNFRNMYESTPKRILEEEGAFILKILPFCSVVPVQNSFPIKDIFNDLALHIFSVDSITEDKNFWETTNPPSYPDSVEIIFGKK